VSRAVGPLSSSQTEAWGAKESDCEEEEPAYPMKCLHQPAVTFLRMAHYTRAVTGAATLGEIALCFPERLGKSRRDRGSLFFSMSSYPTVLVRAVSAKLCHTGL
jgi:hypothetical protein